MDLSSIDNHIRHVTREHDKLDAEIERVLRQKSWNEFDVENLKKTKLKLKDELSKLHRRRYDLAQEVDWDDDR
jgi:uncharacterized protein YdcH (DUF465 family)